MKHPGSVGRPVNAELKILDEDMREMPQGEVGEIFFRPNVHPEPTYRYIGSPPAKTTPDGFIDVGDMGHVDPEGYLFLSDRRVDLIIRGGANIYPAEVEAALSEHPDVADVAVVGIPHDELGKSVHAIVEPRPGTTPDEGVRLACLDARASYRLQDARELRVHARPAARPIGKEPPLATGPRARGDTGTGAMKNAPRTVSFSLAP